MVINVQHYRAAKHTAVAGGRRVVAAADAARLVCVSAFVSGHERIAGQGLRNYKNTGCAAGCLAGLAAGKFSDRSFLSCDTLDGLGAVGRHQRKHGTLALAGHQRVAQTALALLNWSRIFVAGALRNIYGGALGQCGSLASILRRRKADGLFILQCCCAQHIFSGVRPVAGRRLPQLLLFWICDCCVTYKNVWCNAGACLQLDSAHALCGHRRGRILRGLQLGGEQPAGCQRR